MNDQLVTVIENCDTILTQSVFNDISYTGNDQNIEECVSTSTLTCQTSVVETNNFSQEKSKNGKRKTTVKNTNNRSTKKHTKKYESENYIACPICNGKYDNNADWIQCDLCKEWVQETAVGLSHLSNGSFTKMMIPRLRAHFVIKFIYFTISLV